MTPAKLKKNAPRLIVFGKSAKAPAPLKDAFKAQDWTAVWAADMDELNAELRAATPDLVIVDFDLSASAAEDAVKRVRENDREFGCYVPVLGILPTGTKPAIKERVLESGVDDYLTGSFDAVDAGARVAALIRVRELHKRSQFLATHDPLTRCYNRAFLLDFMQREFGRFERFKTPFGYMTVGFSGQPQNAEGTSPELFLMQVGFFLQDFFRAVDCVAYLGNGLFAVVLPGASVQATSEVGHRLEGAVQVKFSGAVHCRMDMIAVPEQTRDWESLLRRTEDLPPLQAAA